VTCMYIMYGMSGCSPLPIMRWWYSVLAQAGDFASRTFYDLWLDPISCLLRFSL
jgi:hypothetical protein